MADLVFSSELENLSLIDDFTEQIKSTYLIDDEKFMDIKLSIIEAVSNAIIHGNKMDTTKQVMITEDMQDDFLVIRIDDQGHGFDPSTIQDPTCKKHLSIPGGRGIHLMRHLSDHVDYSKNGQSVILRFKL